MIVIPFHTAVQSERISFSGRRRKRQRQRRRFVHQVTVSCCWCCLWLLQGFWLMFLMLVLSSQIMIAQYAASKIQEDGKSCHDVDVLELCALTVVLYMLLRRIFCDRIRFPDANRSSKKLWGYRKSCENHRVRWNIM